MKTAWPILLVLLILAAPAAVLAQTYTNSYGIWNFMPTNGAITITGYTGTNTVVTIPTNINGLTVTSIGSGQWPVSIFSATNMTSVTVPDSITSIGDCAFIDCTSLTNAMIGTNVTGIGFFAFEGCSSLTNVTIPNSVTSIGDFAFNGCISLSSITIPNGVTSIGYEAFNYCISLSGITIPNSVTNIGDAGTFIFFFFALGDTAFFDCGPITVAVGNSNYSSTNGVLFDKSQSTLIEAPTSLAGIYAIPNSVTSIGDQAFDSCANLTSVTIPNSVTSIGYEAFNYCISLSGITIPNSVTNIGDDAFFECTSLTSVYFTGNAPEVGSGVFDDLNWLGQQVPDNATVYYLPGTTGWSNTFASLPAVLWNPLIIASGPFFGMQNNQFGFVITNTANLPIAVDLCTNLANPIWSPLLSFKVTNNSLYFSGPVLSDSPGHFFRLSPH